MASGLGLFDHMHQVLRSVINSESQADTMRGQGWDA